MKSIHPEILARFDNILNIRRLPFPVRPEYRKWLRYFLDFQAKYPQPGERSDQVRLFSEKLRSKGQTETQVRQAADAVSLFFVSQQKAPVAPASIRPASVPHPVVSGAAEPPHTEDSVQSPGGKVSGMICEPPGSPVPDEHSTRRRGRFDDWRCLRKTGYPAWDAIIASLADEIKARHYSRKTLQHYANWTRKFQSYLAHKEPAQLSPEDVKRYLAYLAANCKVSSSTQNLAFNALLFLYRHILKKDFGDHKDIPPGRSRRMFPWCCPAMRSRRFLPAWGMHTS